MARRSLLSQLAQMYGAHRMDAGDGSRADSALSRRDLLAASGAIVASLAAAPLADGAFDLSTETRTDSTTDVSAARGPAKRVAIVGAGLAGLSCALKLLSSLKDHVDVTMFEARQRVGGRCLTIQDKLTGQGIDVGASDVLAHHKAVRAIAKVCKVPLVDAHDQPVNLVLDGRVYTTQEAQGLFTQLSELEKRCVEAAKSMTDFDPSEPWLFAQAGELDKTSVEQAIFGVGALADQAKLDSTARALARSDLRIVLGSDLARTSWLAFLTMLRSSIDRGHERSVWSGSQRLGIAGGSSELIAAMVQKVGEKRIMLGSTISSILSTDDQRVRLTETSGLEHIFDHVVITTPPGTWQDQVALSESTLAADARSTTELSVASDAFASARALIAQHRGLDAGAIVVVGTSKSAVWRQRGSIVSDQAFASVIDSQRLMRKSGQASPSGSFVALCTGASASEVSLMRSALRERSLLALMTSVHPSLANLEVEFQTINWRSDPRTLGGYDKHAQGVLTDERFAKLVQQDRGPVWLAGDWLSPAHRGTMEGAIEVGVQTGAKLSRILAAN